MSTATDANTMTGTVLEIQRMSTEDGPGIRTTVFMKGCTLKCAWCHNPESISSKPQIHWIGVRCIGCKRCIEVCPVGALSFTEEGISINRDLCTGCGICADECPSTAMELLGEEWTVEDLFTEIIKDRAYFEKSGGGITIGGGESTLQTDFIANLLKRLKEAGIHTAIDTCGQTRRESLDMILPYTDLVLYDIKESDTERHRAFTGSGNERILENLIYVDEYVRNHVHPKEIWIRTPIIPGATDSEENIRGIGAFIRDNLSGAVSRWELLSFNNLCRDKYLRLGIDWQFKDCELISKETMENLTAVARNCINPERVQWSGSTRLEETDHPKEEAQSRIRGSCSTP